MDALLDTIRSRVSVPPAEGRRLRSLFTRRQYKKHAVLLNPGEVAHELFYILKGALRQHFHDEKGNERTCNFAFEGTFLTDLESFSRQGPAATQITALEPVTCLVIPCKDLAACMQDSPEIARFFNRMVEEVAAENIRRIQGLLSQSPQEQFEHLLASRPGILQRVPQRYIAQYLGIAPESLSRMRRRKLESEKT